MTNASATPPLSYEPEPILNSEDSNNDRSKGLCQTCSRNVPVDKLTFRQNKGAIYKRFYKEAKGNFCAECSERFFWKYTGTTLLLGWWGIISFFVTPFILASNLWNYLKAAKLRRSVKNLVSIEIGWKVTIIFITLAFMSLAGWGLFNAAHFLTPQAEVPIAALEAISSPTAVPILINSPLPLPSSTVTAVIPSTPTPAKSCTLWSQVSILDQGKMLCVYGTVSNAYFGDAIYYMTFSTDPNAFRFIALDGAPFENVIGSCIMAEGIVKTYGQMPYIEVGKDLLKCK